LKNFDGEIKKMVWYIIEEGYSDAYWITMEGEREEATQGVNDITAECWNCGKIIYLHPSENKNAPQFCSDDCEQEYY